MTSVRRALVLSLLERYLLIVLALASNIILARLLTPEQIGIYSVSLAVIGIAQVLRDFGIGNYLIQAKELDEGHVRTAFGLSLIIGGSLFVFVAAVAPSAADFYGEGRMVSTLRISALNFIVLPFCTVSMALLRREMRFQRLLFVTLAAAVLGFAVSVGLALNGLGPDSMAWGAVAMNVATGIGAWLAREQRQLLLPSLSHWRALLHFGAHSSATSVVTTISMDINDLALGRILGFAPVAIFSRAQGLASMFSRDLLAAVRNVALPAYARVHREGLPVEPQHVSSVAGVTAVAWPFFGFLALFPLDVLRLLYGTQWDAAAPLVLPLALAGALYATSSLVSSVLIAVGRVELVTRVELVFQPLRAGLIVIAALVFQSLMACALAYMASLLLYAPLYYRIKQRCLPTDWPAMRNALGRSGLVALSSLALPAMLSLAAGWSRDEPLPLAWFAGAIAACALVWVLALQWLRHPLAGDPLVQRVLRRLPLLDRGRREA